MRFFNLIEAGYEAQRAHRDRGRRQGRISEPGRGDDIGPTAACAAAAISHSARRAWSAWTANTDKLGLVVWLDRDAVKAAIARRKERRCVMAFVDQHPAIAKAVRLIEEDNGGHLLSRSTALARPGGERSDRPPSASSSRVSAVLICRRTRARSTAWWRSPAPGLVNGATRSRSGRRSRTIMSGRRQSRQRPLSHTMPNIWTAALAAPSPLREVLRSDIRGFNLACWCRPLCPATRPRASLSMSPAPIARPATRTSWRARQRLCLRGGRMTPARPCSPSRMWWTGCASAVGRWTAGLPKTPFAGQMIGGFSFMCATGGVAYVGDGVFSL